MNDFVIGRIVVLVPFKTLPFIKEDCLIPQSSLVIISEVLPMSKPFNPMI